MGTAMYKADVAGTDMEPDISRAHGKQEGKRMEMILQMVLLALGFLMLVWRRSVRDRRAVRDSAAGGRTDDCVDGNEYAGGGGKYQLGVKRERGNYDRKHCGK